MVNVKVLSICFWRGPLALIGRHPTPLGEFLFWNILKKSLKIYILNIILLNFTLICKEHM
jgi:hypothetical protein